jgi:ATP-dependent Clp protease adaptor protein ClpS
LAAIFEAAGAFRFFYAPRNLMLWLECFANQAMMVQAMSGGGEKGEIERNGDGETAGPTRGGAGNGNNGSNGDDRGIGTGIVTKTRAKTKKPSLYKVLLLNDDYTPMEFVVHVLERFFSKPREEAVQIMLHVHRHGVGICGVYTFEVAETKVAQVIELARRHQHPLQCTMEKE